MTVPLLDVDAPTPADVAAFERAGYWVGPILVGSSEVSRLRESLDRLWAQDYDGAGFPPPTFGFNPNAVEHRPDRLRVVNFAWWVSRDIEAVVRAPALARLAAGLLRVDALRLFRDIILDKPPSAGGDEAPTNVGWHQDCAYSPCMSTSNLCTAWIALQRTTIHDGGLRYIRGSHRHGPLGDTRHFVEQDLDQSKAALVQHGIDWVEDSVELEPGQVCFHHFATVHGSGPNLGAHGRAAITATFMPDGCSYAGPVRYQDTCYMLGPHPRVGQRFGDPYFPLVHGSIRDPDPEHDPRSAGDRAPAHPETMP